MAINKLPGVYFKESVTQNNTYEEINKCPLFIIQADKKIDEIADKIVEFTSYTELEDIINSKGADTSITYIEQVINEGNISRFYATNVTTDSATAFTKIIDDSAHIDDITSVVYIEDKKSSTSNSITSKITAIKNGVNNNSESGTFRIAYIIPAATINDAISKKDKASEEVIVDIFNTITTAGGDGRVCLILPDENAGSVTGKCINTPYDEEAGFTPLNNIVPTQYNFTNSQLIALQNQGVIFAKKEKVQGRTQHRINLAVTTSWKNGTSDGLLVSRTIADEVLRQISYACQGYIKAKESESTLAAIEAEVSNIISQFITNGSIVQSGTNISVSDAGNNTFIITGAIQTIKSVVAIEVNTTLS